LYTFVLVYLTDPIVYSPTMTGKQYLNRRQLALYGLTGVILGLIYISLVNGFSRLYPFINGICIGLLLGLMIGALEVYVFYPKLKQNSFLLMLTVRVTVYTLCIIIIILVIVTVSRAIRHDQSFFTALQSEESMSYIFRGNFRHALLFTILATILTNFSRLVSFKIGRGILTDFFLGQYHQPKQRERVFVFIQVTNAEVVLRNSKIEAYHQFINELFREISIIAMRHNGYVYEYVDDQIILYWKCDRRGPIPVISFYQEVSRGIQAQGAYFMRIYNLIPVLQWGAHGGKVIQAEIGELKTEIVFHGDVLNTAARIAAIERTDHRTLIFSQYVFDNVDKREGVPIHPIETIELRGKLLHVPLYSLVDVSS